MTTPHATEVLPGIRSEFRRSVALVIGIGAYGGGITPLQSAAADAASLAEILRREHAYQVTLLVDAQATRTALAQAFAALPTQCSPDDRVLIYFAGHGQTLDTQEGSAEGYLIPADADRTRTDTWLPYAELMGALEQLACRHMLLILDCCFAGSVRWAEQGRSQKRDLTVMPKKLFRERYLRFIEAPAWQVLTSSAGDQTASDVGFDQLAGLGEHSPFAQALFTVLEGKRAGLLRDDGVITATDLYSYLRDEIELPSLANGQRQTPQLWPLTKHDRGEFVFLSPGRNPYELPANPSFRPENNPYLGLSAFDEQHSSLLFGRTKVASWLAGYVRRAPLTVVTGPSGSGKTSLVQAGLLPLLRADETQTRTILPTLRLNVSPNTALDGLDLPPADPATLAGRVGAWAAANPDAQLVLVIDQLEDLYLPTCTKADREHVLGQLAKALAQHPEQLRVVLTVRADYALPFAERQLAEHWLPDRVLDLAGWNMSDDKDALQDAISGPAGERALFFESDSLVSKIVNAAIRRPGALPLLSLTLSHVYLRYLARRPDDRTIVADDYFGLSERDDGLTGALLRHAESVYAGLDLDGQLRMQQLLLRMVSLEGDAPAPRKASFTSLFNNYLELDFPPEIGQQQRATLELLAAQRLVVIGCDAAGAYAEPAHEALIQRWERLQGWLSRDQDNVLLQRRLFPAAKEWKKHSANARTLLDRRRAVGQLWLKDNPDLDRARVGVSARNSWMNAVEREFVQVSVAEQARQRRRRWIGLIATAAALGVLAFAAISQLIYNNLLEQRAVVQRLIFGSHAPPAGAPADTGLLLAAEAVTRASSATLVSDTLTLEAVQNLRDILAQPELVTPIDSADDAEYLAPSADGQHVLLRGESTARLWGIDGAPTVDFPVDGVVAADISSDGQHVATINPEGLIQLWDAQGNEQARMQHEESIIQDLALLPGAPKIISISFDNSVQVWEADGSLLSASEPLDSELDAVIASPDGRYALLLAGFGPAWLWDVAEERAIPLTNPAGSPDDLDLREGVVGAFSPDGQHVAVGWDDGAVEVWDIAGTLDSAAAPAPVMLLGHTAEVRSVAFNPDSTQIVTASSDATARLWSLDGTPGIILKEHGDEVASAQFSPDGSTILTASVDATARLWGLDGYQRLILRHTDPLDMARFSFDGRYVLAMTTDRRAVRWPAAPQLPGVVRGAATNIRSLAISPDHTTLLTAANEDVARLWDLNGRALGTLSGHDSPVISAIFSPDGQHILTTAIDGTIHLWDRQGRQLQRVEGTIALREAAVFSPDSQRFLTIDDTVARLWDLSGRELATLQGHEELVTSIAFSPDGQRMLTGSDDTTVRLWDLSGRELKVLNGHFDIILGAFFSPDGQRIVTFADDRTTCVWDLNGNRIAQIQNKNAVISAVFSPDSRYLLTMAEDNTPLLWDLAQAGEPQALPLQGHTSRVVSAVFSPDGQHILTASEDRTARQWSLGGKAELVWRGHSGPVQGAIYGPPDAAGAPSMIITAAADGSMRLLPFARDALLAQVACRAGGAIDGQVLQDVAGDTLTVEPEFDTGAYACPLPSS